MKILRFKKDERGAVLPIVAVFIAVVAFGLAALVIDTGMLYFQRRNMVASADAGALAGARELYTGMSVEEIKQMAADVSVANGADAGRVTVTVNKSATAKYPYPHVIVETLNNTNLVFAKVFGIESSDVYAKAVARADKVLNPGIIPLFMIDTEFQKLAVNQIDAVHEKPVTIVGPDGKITTVDFSSGLLYFDNNISGIPGVKKYLGLRDFVAPKSLIDDLTNFRHIPGKPGLGEIDNNNELPSKSIFTNWFEMAAAHSSSPKERRAYMTGFIPVMDSQRYLKSYLGTGNDKKNFPVAYFAEVVIIDYVDKNNGDGIPKAFVYQGADAYVKQVSTPYNWASLFEKKNDIAKTIIFMKTGKTITIEQMLAGDYAGTIYENDSIRKATLVD